MNLCDKPSGALFHGRHFDSDIITLCVRWYITYKLSYRDLAEMMAERQVDLAHTTIMHWVQRYVPELAKRSQRSARPARTSWRIEETYIWLKGQCVYLYPGVDKEGHTIDFVLREQRYIAA
jgi:transposase-like protein